MPLSDFIGMIHNLIETGKHQKAFDEFAKGYGFPSGLNIGDIDTMVKAQNALSENQRAQTEFAGANNRSPAMVTAQTGEKAEPSESAYRLAAGKNLEAEAGKTNLATGDMANWLKANPSNTMFGSDLSLKQQNSQSAGLDAISRFMSEYALANNMGANVSGVAAPLLKQWNFPSTIGEALKVANTDPTKEATLQAIRDAVSGKQKENLPSREKLTQMKESLEKRRDFLQQRVKSPESQKTAFSFPMMGGGMGPSQGVRSVTSATPQEMQRSQMEDYLRLEEVMRHLKQITDQFNQLPPDESEGANQRLKDYLERERLQ